MNIRQRMKELIGMPAVRVHEATTMILITLLARPEISSLGPGALISLPGMLLRIWASGYPPREEGLSIAGPYQYVRHPHHLGTFLVLLGLCVASRSIGVTVYMLLGVLFIFRAIFVEEGEWLSRKAGLRYREYRLWVPPFIPALIPYRQDGVKEKFSFNYSMFHGRHRELNPCIALLMGYLLLYGFMKIPDPALFQMVVAGALTLAFIVVLFGRIRQKGTSWFNPVLSRRTQEKEAEST